MGSTVLCMGVSIFVSQASGISRAQPNALDGAWCLTLGALLQSSGATMSRWTKNIFLSVLSDTLLCLGAFLLFCVAWMQLAVLSGHSVPWPSIC